MGTQAAAGNPANVDDQLKGCLQALREVQQTAKVGSWRFRFSDGRIWWSEGIYRIFGLAPEGGPLSPALIFDLVHPDDRETFEAQVASREPHRSDYRIVLPDGSIKHIHEEVRVDCDAQGNPLGLYGTAQDVSERARTEEILEDQRSWLDAIVTATSDWVWEVDVQGRYTHVGDRVREFLGYEPQELIGRSPFDLMPPEEADRVGKIFAEIARDRRVFSGLENVNRHKDGRLVYLETSGVPVVDAGGAHRGYRGLDRNITEKKLTEKALRKSEKMLQAIIDAEPECVKLLDENSALVFMNRAGLEMLQVDSLDEVRGQCVCPLVTSEHRQAFLDLTKRVFLGESGTLLFEMVGARGRHLWLEMHAVPLRGENDAIVALLGVTRDVTERKRVEEALRTSETRFRSIIEGAREGIVVADAETGKFHYANPEICRLLGYSEQDFSSLTTVDLAVPEEKSESAAGFRSHVEGRLRVTERTLRRKDGSPVRMSISSVPMEFDGRPSLVGFFTDITERRLLEEERLRSQKLESIGTLAGGIAHDFNNLLQGIFGYISMAKLSLGHREKAHAMLEQAENALHQAVNLTTQLLTFSKGGKPVREVVDLRPVIENAVRFALSGSRVTPEISIDHDLCAVEVDEGQIGQVLQNIVLNADQAMPLGGRIRISARNVPTARAAELALGAGDALVEVAVRDQGIGIPPAHLPRIFDPYFTTKEKGSGLGLATSYSIVKNHGGVIHAQSRLGEGTAFTIYLPATDVAGEPPAAVEAQRASARCRVLVMDDEEIVRTITGELLQALGHEAEFAADGAAAIAKYASAKAAGNPFDVVILDLTIRGGMGGAEAAQRLRELDPAVRTVVSSGYSDDEVVATFRQHGFRSSLKKPYKLGELNRALQEALA